MIESLTIKNFMCFRDETEISFVASKKEKSPEDTFWYKEIDGKRILRLVLIYGLNGSGKSAVLEALETICKIVCLRSIDYYDMVCEKCFDYDEETRKQPCELSIIYYIDNNRYRYYVKCDRYQILEEELKLMTGRPMLIYNRRNVDDKDTIKYGTNFKITKFDKDIINKVLLHNESILSLVLGEEIENSILWANYGFFACLDKIQPCEPYEVFNLLLSIDKINQEKKSFIVNTLKEAGTGIVDYHFDDFDPDILPFLPKNVQEYCLDLLKENKTYKHLDIDYEINDKIYSHVSYLNSKGIMDVIQYLAYFYDLFTTNGVAYSDDFGTGIHPKFLSLLLKIYLCTPQKTQLIMTSNDTSLLNLDYLRRDSIRIVEKDTMGVSTVNRLEYLHKSISLYNSYNKMVAKRIDKLMEKDNFKKHMDSLINILNQHRNQ